MTATEILREEVKQYIETADDKALRMVKAILEIEQEEDEENSVEGEHWDDLPEELKVITDESIKEADEGGGIPHEEVVAKYFNKWSKK